MRGLQKRAPLTVAERTLLNQPAQNLNPPPELTHEEKLDWVRENVDMSMADAQSAINPDTNSMKHRLRTAGELAISIKVGRERASGLTVKIKPPGPAHDYTVQAANAAPVLADMTLRLIEALTVTDNALRLCMEREAGSPGVDPRSCEIMASARDRVREILES